MRRKILQDFANVLCQQFIDLGSGGDVATFVALGSGEYALDLINGECSHDGVPIPELAGAGCGAAQVIPVSCAQTWSVTDEHVPRARHSL